MAELTVDLTYGTALFEAAEEVGKKELIMDEAEVILDLLEENPDLRLFMNHPTISADEKKQTLESIFRGKICDELLNFLFVLIDKRRTGNLPQIIKVYKHLTDEEDGVATGTVYSVIPLTDDRLREIEEETSKLVRINVKLHNKIDPRLIGGIKIMVEGKIINASVRKKFDDLESQIN